MGVGPVYLADKSAWEQARYSPIARDRIRTLRGAGQLATCVVTVAELLYTGRNSADLIRIRADLSTLPFLHLTPEAEARVPETMSGLAAGGLHRRPVADLLLAAIAQAASAVVLHYDADFEHIAQATGQPHEWIVPRGTGHGNA
ncbi:MAG: PIN domain-containing protein [Sporichthyaceae bacterium]